MNEQKIWMYLKNNGLTDAGAAGLMGNLYAESGLSPINLQNTYNKKLGYTDEGYTQAVDNQSYLNFIKDKAGYGLAQWTFWSRKQNLLEYSKKRQSSIGNLDMQLDFLMIELTTSYKNLLNILKNTNSVREASNAVLFQFERPADQGNKVQNRRFEYSQGYYNKYANQIVPSNSNKGEKNNNMKYTENNPPLVCMQTNSTCYKQTRKMNIVGVLWHSTGVNNPNLKRFIQPLPTDKNYSQMMSIIGKNTNGMDYNHHSYQSGLNAWIGKDANGEVRAIQTMPWNFRPWGCGAGSKGSCNTGWIQFEICEDALNDPNYFNQVYKEACELTAYLCKKFNIDPTATVKINGVKIPTILCHCESHTLGFGSNHADVLHWFPRFGKNMDTARADVLNLLMSSNEQPSIPPIQPPVIPTPTFPVPPTIIQEDDNMTQEKFNQMMNTWILEQAEKQPSNWSQTSREWGERNGLVKGDEKGRKMYKKFLTREEFIEVLYRALHNQMP